MAARNPAAPPPTIRTSCAARTTPSLTAPLLVGQHPAAVVDDHVVDAAVVELLPARAAAAGVAQVLRDQALVVLGHVPLAAAGVPAGCEAWLENGSGGTHGPSPSPRDKNLRPAPTRVLRTVLVGKGGPAGRSGPRFPAEEAHGQQ